MPPANPIFASVPSSQEEGLKIKVVSPSVTYSQDHITAEYVYRNSKVSRDELGNLIINPTEKAYTFKTESKVPKIGLMMVGWGGNNGSTLTASILANRREVKWMTKEGEKISQLLWLTCYGFNSQGWTR
ncbi:Myo-inositol-1-phosphate synthase [Entomophthora muscae]|uniref:Myo-inositol-1-phosphate synthase n=1 Tax=Entomophthora muscae TaxID=34485 RepID=A0ACC2SX67_9FUNG|nr:Myo-inositol-1-phosphate synthase [Entomophthora muscae]